MIIKLENSKEKIDTDTLVPIGEGKDGTVYQYQDKILKINTSGYMTEEKIKDLRNAIPNNQNIRIVPPIEIATETKGPKKRVVLNIADGYTSRFIKENPSFILMKETYDFLEEIAILRQQTHEYLSNNEIGLSDSNPNNILVSLDNGGMYLIDHDRNITPSCMYTEKEYVQNQDYHTHNDRKLALLMYKSLLLQLLKFNGIKFTNGGDPVLSFVEKETARKDITFETVENALKEYKYISEYTRATIQKIKRR